MRNIFITLLLLNIAYFAYKTLLDQRAEPVAIARSSVAAAESIYLLSENANSDIRNKELELIINNPVRDVGSNEGGIEKCLAVGPFPDIFMSQGVADRLLALGISVEVKAVDLKTELNDYRVMIPPAQSLQSAFRKLRELKSQGIDSYVITQGAGALSISLGVFSTEQAALGLQSELLSSGYEVIVSNIPRVTREYWIMSSEGQNLEVEAVVWASLIENNPNIENKLQQCVEIEY